MDTNDKKPSAPATPGPVAGESNARAVRNPAKPAPGAPGTTASTASAVPAGQQRVRMLRDQDGHLNGQEVSLPADQAQALIHSGAAQAV